MSNYSVKIKNSAKADLKKIKQSNLKSQFEKVIQTLKEDPYHVLIIQVYKPTELDKGVSFIQPKFKSFFLKKAAKGFQKTQYVTMPEEESIVTSDKNQEINRKRPFIIRKTSK